MARRVKVEVVVKSDSTPASVAEYHCVPEGTLIVSAIEADRLPVVVKAVNVHSFGRDDSPALISNADNVIEAFCGQVQRLTIAIQVTPVKLSGVLVSSPELSWRAQAPSRLKGHQSPPAPIKLRCDCPRQPVL